MALSDVEFPKASFYSAAGYRESIGLTFTNVSSI